MEDVLQKPVHMQQVGDKCLQKEVDCLEFEWVLELVHERLEEKECVAHQVVLQR